MFSSKLKTLLDTFIGYSWWFEIACRSRKFTPSKSLTTRRHIVLVVWTFPPDISGGVYRPLSLARYGVEHGWKITIIAGPLREEPSSAGLALLESLPDEVDVYRMQSLNDPKPSYNWFPGLDGGLINGLSIFKTAVRELTEIPPSVVVGSGPPFNSFMAAFYLSRFFGAKLVLDYRDEWTECPFSFVRKGAVDVYMERKCLRRADAVFFTTQSQLEHNCSTFQSGSENRFHVIANGWEPADFKGSKRKCCEATKSDKVTLSFVGALGDHTLPSLFLETLENILSRRRDLRHCINLQFIGTRSDEGQQQIDRFSFPEIMTIHGHVDKKTANLYMEESSALLLFYNNSFQRYIPGKFYDYLAAGCPILVFGTKGEVPNILRKLGGGIFVQDGDEVGLESALDRLLDGEGISLTAQQNIEEWLKQHTRECMAIDFIEKIEGLFL